MRRRKRSDSPARAFVQQSIRFSADNARWLSSESTRTRTSINAVVRALIDDASSYFGLGPSIVAILEKDRSSMELSHRRYVQEILARRYSDLLLSSVSQSTID